MGAVEVAFSGRVGGYLYFYFKNKNSNVVPNWTGSLMRKGLTCALEGKRKTIWTFFD